MIFLVRESFIPFARDFVDVKKDNGRRRDRRLTTGSQRRTTNEPSDKSKYTEPSKIIDQRSRYLKDTEYSERDDVR